MKRQNLALSCSLKARQSAGKEVCRFHHEPKEKPTRKNEGKPWKAREREKTAVLARHGYLLISIGDSESKWSSATALAKAQAADLSQFDAACIMFAYILHVFYMCVYMCLTCVLHMFYILCLHVQHRRGSRSHCGLFAICSKRIWGFLRPLPTKTAEGEAPQTMVKFLALSPLQHDVRCPSFLQINRDLLQLRRKHRVPQTS